MQTGCFDNLLILVPELPSNASFNNDTFLVEVTGVEDMYGNVSEDTVEWAFTVAGPEMFSIGENEDTDGDSILNKDDNCPYAYNPGQEDLDLDGIGDQCDEDIDGDNVNNAVDNCPTTPNPDQVDVNNDGIGDACQSDFTSVRTIKVDQAFRLLDNFPNPFNDMTTIRFYTPKESRVIIRIHDAHGAEVAILTDRSFAQGTHEVTWDSKDEAPGLYFYSMDAVTSDGQGVYRQTRKMMLLE